MRNHIRSFSGIKGKTEPTVLGVQSKFRVSTVVNVDQRNEGKEKTDRKTNWRRTLYIENTEIWEIPFSSTFFS